MATKKDDQPLGDRVVKYGLRTPDFSGYSFQSAGRTDQKGEVVFDLYAEARRDPGADEVSRTAKTLTAFYQNPDALDDRKQPNFCSSETTVSFRYTGPPARQ